jgi:hypothetical protein
MWPFPETRNGHIFRGVRLRAHQSSSLIQLNSLNLSQSLSFIVPVGQPCLPSIHCDVQFSILVILLKTLIFILLYFSHIFDFCVCVLYFRAFRSPSRYRIFMNRIRASIPGSTKSPCMYRMNASAFLGCVEFRDSNRSTCSSAFPSNQTNQLPEKYSLT